MTIQPSSAKAEPILTGSRSSFSLFLPAGNSGKQIEQLRHLDVSGSESMGFKGGLSRLGALCCGLVTKNFYFPDGGGLFVPCYA
jgi:hypothetical protein